ncbi:hypothetical protein GCU68_21185 (plasmid) [Natronorubrum aibiense]|uniref:Uncharacterized protein n=1 Tax=Natronorubrum aibiense TaxID=348826 RepID=A0A5P9PAB5_9EURY|nr:hypothetical protein GCU68_21185 [Natronorubrum aibiense]
MYGDSKVTGAFGGVHLVLIAIIMLALIGTSGLYLLGLPVSWLGAAFVILLIGLSVVARPLFRKAQPRRNRNRDDN